MAAGSALVNGWTDKSGIEDELELGERAAGAIMHESSGMLYSSARDRAWSVVLGCYGSVARALGPGHPEAKRWHPDMDEHGMWRGTVPDD